MGYSRCKVIFAICASYALKQETWADPALQAATNGGIKVPDIDGFRASLPERWKPLLIGPVLAPVNDWVMYAFLWDGSQEGWDDAEAGDVLREQFTEMFSGAYGDGSSPFQVLHAEFRWGGDEPTGWGDVAELEVTSNAHQTRIHPNHGVTAETLEFALEQMEQRGGGSYLDAVRELQHRFGFDRPTECVDGEAVEETPAITM